MEINFQKKQALNHTNAFNSIVDVEFLASYEKIRHRTMLSVEVLYDFWRSVEYVEKNNIEGSILELGVWKGGSLGLVGLCLEKSQSQRNVIGVDTCEGHPAPAQNEVDVWGNNMKERYEIEVSKNGSWAKACHHETTDFLQEIYGEWGRFTLIKGKIQDKVKELRQIDKISILRLDMDWYEPTLLALNEFYDRLSKNGVIIIDDYGHHSGARDAFDEFIASNNINPLMHHINYSCIAGLKS